MMDILDDDDQTPTFSKRKWIGRGKVFPTNPFDVPRDLEAFYNDALKIPSSVRTALLPDPNLPVEQFLKLKLPLRTTALVNLKAKTCFRHSPPARDIVCLQTRALPDRALVKDAKKELGQALLDGAQLIADPNYKGKDLPLWVIQFWTEMYEVLEKRAQWARSQEWLDRTGNGTATEETIGSEWVFIIPVLWVLIKQMIHDHRVLHVFPINTICR
jgi:hypothetical protein